MMDDLEDLSCHWLCALEDIEANKLRIAKYYNKKVKSKQFFERGLGLEGKITDRIMGQQVRQVVT